MIYYSNFDTAPALGDVTIAVQDFNSATVTGVTSYTTSTLTGVTPKGAFILGSTHLPANDPGDTAYGSIMLGVVDDAGTDFALSYNSQSGTTSTNTKTASRDVNGWAITENTNNRSSADVSVTSGGLSFNFGTVHFSGARKGAFVAFAGADCETHSGIINLGTGTSAIDITAPGFQPDVVIFFGTHPSWDGLAIDALTFSFGVALADGTQRTVIWSEPDAAADGSPFQTLDTDACGGQITPSTGALAFTISAGDFDASGFSVTPSANTGSSRIGYLAIKVSGRQVALMDYTTPTSTGSSPITGVGFEPQFALAAITNLEAVDSYPGTTSDNQGGVGICLIGDEQWSATTRIDSGAATTNTACRLQNYALLGASATSTAAIAASLTSFDSDGMTLNYSAVQGAGKKGFILFIE